MEMLQEHAHHWVCEDDYFKREDPVTRNVWIGEAGEGVRRGRWRRAAAATTISGVQEVVRVGGGGLGIAGKVRLIGYIYQAKLKLLIFMVDIKIKGLKGVDVSLLITLVLLLLLLLLFLGIGLSDGGRGGTPPLKKRLRGTGTHFSYPSHNPSKRPMPTPPPIMKTVRSLSKSQFYLLCTEWSEVRLSVCLSVCQFSLDSKSIKISSKLNWFRPDC